MVRDDKTNPHVFKILNSVISIRPGNSRHDTTTRNEHDTNTNLTRHEKITKTRHDMDKKMNMTWRYEYLKIV